MAEPYAVTRLDALRQLRREGYSVVDRREVDALRHENAALRSVINTPHHVAVFDEHGWALEHSLDCRLAKTMTTCNFNGAMERFGATIDDPSDLIERGPRWVLIGVDANGMPSLQPETDSAA